MTELGKHATPTLLESLEEVSAFPEYIRPLYRPIRMSGRAYPVQAAPGDNLAVHLALAEVPPGAVLVVATGRTPGHGFWGEITTEAAMVREVQGLVTDGAVRDTQQIEQRQFPVFCAGIAIEGTTKRDAGLINQPITIGACSIRPGDFIVGDDDGVVVIPPEMELKLLEIAQVRVDKENSIIQRLRDGALTVDLLGLREAGRPKPSQPKGGEE